MNDYLLSLRQSFPVKTGFIGLKISMMKLEFYEITSKGPVLDMEMFALLWLGNNSRQLFGHFNVELRTWKLL